MGVAWPAYHVIYQLAERIGVICPNKFMAPALINAAKATGCWDRVVSFRNVPGDVMKTMGPWPHTSEEYEAHHITIAKELVEENDAQLIFCSCAYNMIMLPPIAKKVLYYPL